MNIKVRCASAGSKLVWNTYRKWLPAVQWFQVAKRFLIHRTAAIVIVYRFPLVILKMANCSDRQMIDAISAQYYWHGNPHDFWWATADAVSAVCEYLKRWASPYWEPIRKGGPRGYSLFLHEWTEVRQYRARGADHLNGSDQATHYKSCHAHALLAEHRFLECVAHLMDYRLSLRELVEWNPHGDKPYEDGWERDWDILKNELHHQLSPSDQEFDPANESQAHIFFRDLGFEEAARYHAH